AGCRRPTTRCCAARSRRPPGRRSTSSGRSPRTSRRARSRRVPRPLHPGEAAPAADLAAGRVAGLAAGEGGEAAVVGAEVPDPPRQRRLEGIAEQRVEEEEAGEDAVADDQRPGAQLARLQLPL